VKWLRTLIVFEQGDVLSSPGFAKLHERCVEAVQRIDHPQGSGQLTLRQKEKDENGKWQRNGVGPLRKRFMDLMRGQVGVAVEQNAKWANPVSPTQIQEYPSRKPYSEPIHTEFGPFDVVISLNETRVAIEWETGNISSSHRSLNKLFLALRQKEIDVGLLIVPSRDLYVHLTDRVGNIAELSGYLSVWKSLKEWVAQGALGILVVEHNALTPDPNVPYLAVGKDGRAAKHEKPPTSS